MKIYYIDYFKIKILRMQWNLYDYLNYFNKIHKLNIFIIENSFK